MMNMTSWLLTSCKSLNTDYKQPSLLPQQNVAKWDLNFSSACYKDEEIRVKIQSLY